MRFVLKLFPEITIKSRPVRLRMVRLLRRNVRALLRPLDREVAVAGSWDSIEVVLTVTDPAVWELARQSLSRTPGVALVLDVEKYPLSDFEALGALCRRHFGAALAGHSFAVRCKRSGQHSFRSIDVEREVGARLLQAVPSARVHLDAPEVTVGIEIHDQDVYLVSRQTPGLGGYPLGSQDAVLSLISGGFDSAVSSYLCIKRGLLTHYLFFNLGGMAHERAVKELALFLWMRFGMTHKVHFISVPFEAVVSQIVSQVDNAYMGVVLKRCMVRVADAIAERLGIAALVTGESIAQVSSQTLANLAVIDRVAERLMIRPLITTDKQDIIDLARQIGTEAFSRNIPEYCAVISVKPTTRADASRAEREESRIDPALLSLAAEHASIEPIDEVDVHSAAGQGEVPSVSRLQPGDTVIDLRHPQEVETRPLVLETQEVTRLEIPFYQLESALADQDRDKPLLLYCDRGMMSRLQAVHLRDAGFRRVAVYQPDRKNR